MKLFSVALSAVLIAAAAGINPTFIVNVNPEDPDILACINLKNLSGKKNFLQVGFIGDTSDNEYHLFTNGEYVLAVGTDFVPGRAELVVQPLTSKGKIKNGLNEMSKCDISDVDPLVAVCKYVVTPEFVGELEEILEDSEVDTLDVTLVLREGGDVFTTADVCVKSK